MSSLAPLVFLPNQLSSIQPPQFLLQYSLFLSRVPKAFACFLIPPQNYSIFLTIKCYTSFLLHCIASSFQKQLLTTNHVVTGNTTSTHSPSELLVDKDLRFYSYYLHILSLPTIVLNKFDWVNNNTLSSVCNW